MPDPAGILMSNRIASGERPQGGHPCLQSVGGGNGFEPLISQPNREHLHLEAGIVRDENFGHKLLPNNKVIIGKVDLGLKPTSRRP